MPRKRLGPALGPDVFGISNIRRRVDDGAAPVTPPHPAPEGQPLPEPPPTATHVACDGDAEEALPDGPSLVYYRPTRTMVCEPI